MANDRNAYNTFWARFAAAFAVGTAGAVCLTVVLPARPARAQVRSLVLVFSASVQPGGAGVGVKKEGGDGLTPDARTAAGTRALCSCLNDSSAIMAVRYDPKLSMVVRAENEANLHIVNADDPTAEERLKIADALRAVYTIAVSTQSPPDAPRGTVEMTIEGTRVESHKTYSDHVRMSAGGAARLGSANSPLDGDAIRHFSGNDQLDNVLQSAANTLVQRMLGGPLGDYARTAPPANLLPKDKMPVSSPDIIRPTIPVPPVADAPPLVPGDSRFGAVNTSTPLVTKTMVYDPKAAAAAAAKLPIANRGADNHTYASAAARAGGAPDDEARAAIQQSAAFLSDGDSSAAILMLREAIDQQPLSSALRIALAKTYLTAHRDRDAESEARRALTVLPTVTPASQTDLTQILNQSIAATGDAGGARATYQKIIALQPNAVWPRVALADSLVAEGQNEDAEAQYRAALKSNAADPGAVAGMARLLVERGDYAGAQAALNASGLTRIRSGAATIVFDTLTQRIAERLVKNRAAWEGGTLSREAIFTATSTQSTRVAALITLLKANPPAADAPAAETRAYKRRLYAASLLAQAASDLVSFLQTNDADAGADASLQLGEFQKELAGAQGK